MLQKMALTDALTGLPNRRAMDRLAKTEVLRRARTPAPLAVALVDADNFKSINTRFLLPGGDHVLVWLGQTLVNAVRTIDTVGRVGGEEFMVVAPETDHDGAPTLAERIRRTVELGETEFNGEPIRLTVSVGMVVAEAELLELVHLSQFAHRLPLPALGRPAPADGTGPGTRGRAEVLLLDEPFGALDAKVRKELREWLRRLHDEVHVTTVFVTHDQEEALEVADRSW